MYSPTQNDLRISRQQEREEKRHFKQWQTNFKLTIIFLLFFGLGLATQHTGELNQWKDASIFCIAVLVLLIQNWGKYVSKR